MGYRGVMAESSVPGLGDLLSLFGSTNPFAPITKTFDQFKRGVNDFLEGVETFNKTMESLNGVTTRVNRLLDDIEEPVRALMPQITRSIKTADAVISQLSGPVERVAPGLSRLADTLSAPVFADLPNELASFLETLSDLAKRLQPLTQIAESAGSLFGLRPLSALRSAISPPHSPESPAPQPRPPASAPAAATKSAPKKPAAKKAPVKKPPVKGTTPRKTSATTASKPARTQSRS